MKIKFKLLTLSTVCAILCCAPDSYACSPDALGVSRTIYINTASAPRFGTRDYASLDLKHKEVVLTFDDGPLHPTTRPVLAALANECTLATFFVVGRMVEADPDLTRLIAKQGHTVANHTQNHPLSLAWETVERGKKEIDQGAATLRRVLGENSTAPLFFRFPGFGWSDPLNSHLSSLGVATFSADVWGSDWNPISPQQILQNVMSRLKRKGRGIIVLHDTKHATAAMVPDMLIALKKQGYKVVHIAPDTQKIIELRR